MLLTAEHCHFQSVIRAFLFYFLLLPWYPTPIRYVDILLYSVVSCMWSLHKWCYITNVILSAFNIPHWLWKPSHVTICASSLPFARLDSVLRLLPHFTLRSTGNKNHSQFRLPGTTVNFAHALRSRSKIDFRFHSRHIESKYPEETSMHGNPLLVGLSNENSSLLLALSWYKSTEFKDHKESERFWPSLETGCPLAKKKKKSGETGLNILLFERKRLSW